MKFFLDSADLEEIKKASKLGIISGVTTNPSLMAKNSRPVSEIIREICSLIDGPISAEVISTDYENMVEEGKKLAKIHPNVVIKIPLTIDGIRACKTFTDSDIRTNVTLVFSANQALLAAMAGATYVSPFIGRLDDIGSSGMHLIEEIRAIYDNYAFTTEILAASVRHAEHVRDAAMVGADVATLPLSIIEGLYNHPLTTKGLEKFLQDFSNAKLTLF